MQLEIDGMKKGIGFERRVVEMYLSGMPAPKISDALGCTYYKVYTILEKAGIERRSAGHYTRRVDKRLTGKIKRDYLKNKMSCNELANRYGVSHDTIRKVLLRAGVKLRPKAEAIRIGQTKRRQKEVKKAKPKRLETTNAPVKSEIIRLRQNENAMIQDIALALEIPTPQVYSVLSEAGML